MTSEACARSADRNLALLGFVLDDEHQTDGQRGAASFLLSSPPNSSAAEQVASAAIFHLLHCFDSEAADELRGSLTGTRPNSRDGHTSVSVLRAQASEFRRRATEQLSAMVTATADLEPQAVGAAGPNGASFHHAQKVHAQSLVVRVSDLQRCTGPRFVKLLWKLSGRVLRAVLARSAHFRSTGNTLHLGNDATQNAAWHSVVAANENEAPALSMLKQASATRAKVCMEAFSDFAKQATEVRRQWQEADAKLDQEAAELTKRLSALKQQSHRLEVDLSIEQEKQPGGDDIEQQAESVARAWTLFREHHQSQTDAMKVLRAAAAGSEVRLTLDATELRGAAGPTFEGESDNLDIAALVTAWKDRCASSWQQELQTGEGAVSAAISGAIEQLIPQIERDLSTHAEQLTQVQKLNERILEQLHLHREAATALASSSQHDRQPEGRGSLHLIPPTPASKLATAGARQHDDRRRSAVEVSQAGPWHPDLESQRTMAASLLSTLPLDHTHEPESMGLLEEEYQGDLGSDGELADGDNNGLAFVEYLSPSRPNSRPSLFNHDRDIVEGDSLEEDDQALVFDDDDGDTSESESTDDEIIIQPRIRAVTVPQADEVRTTETSLSELNLSLDESRDVVETADPRELKEGGEAEPDLLGDEEPSFDGDDQFSQLLADSRRVSLAFGPATNLRNRESLGGDLDLFGGGDGGSHFESLRLSTAFGNDDGLALLSGL
jgi:HAUS augmin-like complex subunit 6 N-terminus